MSSGKPRIFSGIQPTGRKHLGNYIGAIRQYISSQERGEALFCIVDLHAITVAYDPAELRRSLYDLEALLLASGLDPERCVLFRQSDVREHTELTWLLCSLTELGRLQRMHQFRDKSIAQRELVSAGLLVYPVLQAADVLAYRAQEVPVGRGPARAPRADARRRAQVQRPLRRRRRGARGARAPHPRGGRADHGPAGAHAQDVHDRRGRGGHGVRARRARCDRAQDPPRGHRLRQRDHALAGEARRLEPDRNPRGCAREHARGGRGADARRARLRRSEGGGRGGGARDACAGRRALRGAPRGRGGARGGARAGRRARSAGSPRPRSPTCAREWAWEPRPLRVGTGRYGERDGRRSARSTSIWTSSADPSTC